MSCQVSYYQLQRSRALTQGIFLDSLSFQGRYVNSDLMKEMFPEYSASKEHRNRYNLPVHNAAAVLAAEQFRAAIVDDSVPGRTNALFLTGVPGAGKTAAVLANRDQDARIVYEGQLSEPVDALFGYGSERRNGVSPCFPDRIDGAYASDSVSGLIVGQNVGQKIMSEHGPLAGSLEPLGYSCYNHIGYFRS